MRALFAFVLYPLTLLSASAWIMSELLASPRPPYWEHVVNKIAVDLQLLPSFALLAFATVLIAHATLGSMALVGAGRWWMHATLALAFAASLAIFAPSTNRLALYPGAYADAVAREMRPDLPFEKFNVARFSAVHPGMPAAQVIATLGKPTYRSDRWFLYRLSEDKRSGWMARVNLTSSGTVEGRSLEAFD